MKRYIFKQKFTFLALLTPYIYIQVLKQGIDLLLKTASVDALARLRANSDRCHLEIIDHSQAFEIYFDHQNHFSLLSCLQTQLETDITDGVMIQVRKECNHHFKNIV